MVWSREALICYIYGMLPEVIEKDGQPIATAKQVSNLLGKSAFPAGLFCNEKNSQLSAIIFTNACSLGKFNRVGVSAGCTAKGRRFVRIGKLFDRTSGALNGIPFCLDVTSEEYRTLWPQGYEPWSAELEVFHNPFARHPISKELLPEATHWFEKNGEIVCSAFYETSILWSRTTNQRDSDRMPTLNDSMSDSGSEV